MVGINSLPFCVAWVLFLLLNSILHAQNLNWNEIKKKQLNLEELNLMRHVIEYHGTRKIGVEMNTFSERASCTTRMSHVMEVMTSAVDVSVSNKLMSWLNIDFKYAILIFAACRSPVCIQHATSVHPWLFIYRYDHNGFRAGISGGNKKC